MQRYLDIFGYLHPARLGHIWDFVLPAGLGLAGGIALGYLCRKAPWLVRLALGVMAAIGALILELIYRRFIFSHEEPIVYEGSALQYGELAMTFLIFALVGSAIEMVLRSSIGGLFKKD